MKAIGIVVCVDGVKSVGFDDAEGRAFLPQCFLTLVKGKLAGEEEAFVVWVFAVQPIEVMFDAL